MGVRAAEVEAMRRIVLVALVLLASLALASPARADEPPSRDRLAELRRDYAELQDALERVTSQRDVALAERAQARAVAAREARDAADWRLTSYAAMSLLLVGAAAAIGRRRHTVRIKIPDTPAPLFDELDDGADRRADR